MRWRVVAAFALVLCACDRWDIPVPETPVVPAGPVYVCASVPVEFRTIPEATLYSGPVRYIIDWGDAPAETTVAECDLYDPDTILHRWLEPGTYRIRCKALAPAWYRSDTSDWSDSTTITILANGVPEAPELWYPPEQAALGVWAFFEAHSKDPDGDSVAIRWSFGDWSPLMHDYGAGVDIPDSARFTQPGSTRVWCIAKDSKGSESDTTWHTLNVGEAGGVRWWWWGSEEGNNEPSGSPLVFQYGGEEQLWIPTYEGLARLDPATGAVLTLYGEAGGGPWEFEGNPAWCAATGHLILAERPADLYAFHPELGVEWDVRVDGEQMGALTVVGNRLYFPLDRCELYLYEDHGDSAYFAALCTIPEIGEAVVVDADGYVYVPSDVGDLFKLMPDLSGRVWRFDAGGRFAYSPVIGNDGTVFVGDDNGYVHAVDPVLGTAKWSTHAAGDDVTRLVVDDRHVYGVSYDDRVFALETETGELLWSEQAEAYCETSPILTANGLLYVADEDGMLCCYRAEDGELVWLLDCAGALSGVEKKRLDLAVLWWSPAILGNGDIIVPSNEATFCVAGCRDGPLAQTAWPKWQHDAHNTGYVNGGSLGW